MGVKPAYRQSGIVNIGSPLEKLEPRPDLAGNLPANPPKKRAPDRSSVIMNHSLFSGIFLCALAAATGGCGRREPAPPPAELPRTYHESRTPGIFSEWRSSDDGAVSVCMQAKAATVGTKKGIALRCALRNNTDKPLTILRPFGDRWYALTSGIGITGPRGEVSYRGPVAGYVLGTDAFTELAPRTVTEGMLELKPDVFPTLGPKGSHTISYTFLSDGYSGNTIPENFWSGLVVANPVTVLLE